MRVPTFAGMKQAAGPSLLEVGFWDSQAMWPRGDDRTVFLGRAVLEAGRAMFGDVWVGDEVLAKHVLPDFPELPAWEGPKGWLSDKRYWQLYGTAPPPPPPMPFDDHVLRFNWEQDRQGWDAYRLENSSRLQRLSAVLEWISDEAINSRLITLARLVRGGGKYFDPADGMWNVEPVETHFRKCQLHTSAPGATVEAPAYIFFTRASFQARLETIRIRRAHPSSMKEADAPLIDEMRALILSGEESGPYPASLRLAGRAQGNATPENKAKRLERRYLERFGK